MTETKQLFSKIIEMTPAQMAQASVYTQNACEYILGKIEEVKNEGLKKELEVRYKENRLRFLELYPDKASKETLRKQLVNKGFLYGNVSLEQFMPRNDNISPVWVASGSGYRGHHAHPGGLVVHIEENLRLTLYLKRMYKKMFALEFDKDMLIYAQLAHDLAKAWLANWRDDSSVFLQFGIADTGAHHIFGLAESILYGISPEYLYCQAATHVPSTSKQSRDVIVGFLLSAFIIAQKDIYEYGILDKDGQLAFDFRREEFWFCNMGDQMLFTVTELRHCTKALQELAQAKYRFNEKALSGKPFNQLRNFLFSQLSVARIFSLLQSKGLGGLQEQIDELIEFD